MRYCLNVKELCTIHHLPNSQIFVRFIFASSVIPLVIQVTELFIIRITTIVDDITLKA